MFLPAFFLSLIFQASVPPPAENKAIEYLSREVPKWSAENHCFSCHNNGDGARALYTAKRLGRTVPLEALSDTTRWITKPGEWEKDHGTPGFSNKALVPIQFAASLVEAIDAGVVKDRKLLLEAATKLVAEQDANGSWQVDPQAAAASPATYGPVVATYMGRRTLEKSGDPRFAEAINRATQWLLKAPAENTMNAAAIALSFKGSGDARAKDKVKAAIDLLSKAQSNGGGWGPFPNTPPEPFDTAMALIGLAAYRDEPGIEQRIRSGRAFLLSNQFPDGGWPETTRPSGGSSYAEHISTTGWATLALLATD